MSSLRVVMFVVTLGGGVGLIALAWRQGWRRRVVVAALIAVSAALQLVGPSPGGGPLIASVAIVLYTAVPAERFHRWALQTLTLLPVLVYGAVAVTLDLSLAGGRTYGAPQFYQAVATVIPTLLVALSFTGRVFQRRSLTVYEVPLALFILYAVGEGEYHALSAIYYQRGTKDDFLLTVSALALAFSTLMFAAVLNDAGKTDSKDADTSAAGGGANGARRDAVKPAVPTVERGEETSASSP